MVEGNVSADQGINSLADERELVEKSTMGKRWSGILYKSSFAILQVCRRYVLMLLYMVDEYSFVLPRQNPYETRRAFILILRLLTSFCVPLICLKVLQVYFGV